MEQPRHHRHPLLRGIGHALGVLYLLVTLLFGPIRSLAVWLERVLPASLLDYKKFTVEPNPCQPVA